MLYEVGAAALLSLVAGTVIVLTRSEKGSGGATLAALTMAVLLGVGGAAWVSATARHPMWWAALWSVPAGLATLGVHAWSGWRRSLGAWGLGVVIGSTLAIPATWAHRVEARMVVGQDRLAALAAADDPPLERTLLRFGAVADSHKLA